jgi:hypothetical protein
LRHGRTANRRIGAGDRGCYQRAGIVSIDRNRRKAFEVQLDLRPRDGARESNMRDRDLREWRTLIRERADREWRALSPDVVDELACHLADLHAAALANGASRADARHRVLEALHAA